MIRQKNSIVQNAIESFYSVVGDRLQKNLKDETNLKGELAII
jgi:hypothetical protein